ncbi:PIN domain-containing protein [Fodinibius sp. SL11]|uniref:PIN domain-containing protein n=1 Tax=Fodinibius sp. SL11 TaxID=3425690 RepID=UPI003F885CF9
MSNEITLEDIESDLSESLEEKFPGISVKWKSLYREFGRDMSEEMKEEFLKFLPSIDGFTRLTVTLVLDNNFVLAQLRGFIKNDEKFEESFIYRLLNSGFVDAYGPVKLKEELYEKIVKHFPESIDKAINYADYILSKITIKDAYFIDAWVKASRQIGEIDRDDVPYLALAIDLDGHAIMSLDKVFDHQSDVKVWEMNDAGRIVANLHQGTFSIGLIGTGTATVLMLYKLVVYIIKALIDVLKDFINAIIGVFELFFNSASKIPKEVVIGLALTAITGLFVSDDFREKSMEAWRRVTENFQVFVEDLKDFLVLLKEQVLELWDVFKPICVTSAQLLFFLITEVNMMVEDLTQLSYQS